MIIADANNALSLLPAVPPTADNIPVDEASAHLQHRLSVRWDDLLAALDSRNFYIELFLILLALIAAGLLARHINRKIRHRLAQYPPKSIDPEFICKPLRLLGATLSVFFLWYVRALVEGLGIGGGLTGGALELGYAYWLTTCVFLAVRQRAVAYVIAGAILLNAILRVARVAQSTSAFLESIAFNAGHFHITALHLINGLILFVVVFWGAGLLSRALESYLRRSTRLSPNARHLTVKFFKAILYMGALVVISSAVGIDLTAFALFSGALGVGIGLGLQKLTSNFVSGLTVLMERSIKIGDLIEVGGNTGWVRQMNIRYVLIETSDGREIIIPNEELMSTRVVNWTLTTTLARIEIKVEISYDSDAEKAKELLLAAALEHPNCMRDPKPGCWLREFTDHGIGFMLAFWIADVKEGRNGPQSDVMFAILNKFRQIRLPLPIPDAGANDQVAGVDLAMKDGDQGRRDARGRLVLSRYVRENFSNIMGRYTQDIAHLVV